MPDALTNVVIPASLALHPTLSIGTLAANDVTVNSGGSLTMDGGATLQVNGNSVNNGTASLLGTVPFVDSAAIQTLSNGGGSATLNAETETSYVVGEVTVTRALNVPGANTLGGIGLSLTPNGSTLPATPRCAASRVPRSPA